MKKINKKLRISKKTISSLSEDNMTSIKGGTNYCQGGGTSNTDCGGCGGGVSGTYGCDESQCCVPNTALGCGIPNSANCSTISC